MAPRFLASAFASGPALLILLCLFLKSAAGFDAGQRAIGSLATIVAYGLLANLFFLFCEIFVVVYSQIPAHKDHFLYLYAGLAGKTGLVPWMRTSFVLMGTAALLLLILATRTNRKILGVACIMVFIGTWIDKGMGLVNGGFIPSPLHQIAEYVPTIPELAISLGVYGIGGLCLTLLLKMAISIKMEVQGHG